MNIVELLKQHVGAHDKISKILDMGDYYGVTNSKILLMLPKFYIPEGVSPDDLSVNPPDTSFIFKSSLRETPFEFTLRQLINALGEVPKVQEYEECSKCDGWGKVECECCGNETKCEDCDGNGNGSEIPGQFSYDYNYIIAIDESHIGVGCFEDIVNLLINLNVNPDETIKMTSSEMNRPHIFEVKDIKFVSVPNNSEYTIKDFVIKIC